MKNVVTKNRSSMGWWAAGYVAVLLLLTLRPFGGNIVTEKEFNLELFRSLENYWRHMSNYGIIDASAWVYFPGNLPAFFLNIFTVSFVNLVGNVVLFMPLGFFLARLFRNRPLAKTVAASMAVSVGIETAQFIGLTSRIADIDDVVLNVAGAILGYVCYRAYDSLKERKWFGGKE